jgi:hypothetical protein
MLFGPLLVFTPEIKMIVSNRFLRAVVGGAQKKETRYVAFAIFLVILASQVCVCVSVSVCVSLLHVRHLYFACTMYHACIIASPQQQSTILAHDVN